VLVHLARISVVHIARISVVHLARILVVHLFDLSRMSASDSDDLLTLWEAGPSSPTAVAAPPSLEVVVQAIRAAADEPSDSDEPTTPRTMPLADAITVPPTQLYNWHNLIVPMPLDGAWASSPHGIVDCREVRHDGEPLDEGTMLDRALTCLETVFRTGTVEHKVGLAQQLSARWLSYRVEDNFSHMLLMATVGGRQAAGILEAALIRILHNKGLTMYSRNFVNRDKGGTGRRKSGCELVDTHVYVMIRAVDPLTERPRHVGERRKRVRVQ
jgi:hypothetical protein